MIFKPALFENQIFGMVLFFLCVAAAIYLVIYGILKISENKKNKIRWEQEKEKNKSPFGMASVLGTRSYQQDRVNGCVYGSDSEECILGVLCDGMGGLSDGERASEFCSKTAVDMVLEKKPEWKSLPSFMKNMIKRLDMQVFEFRDESGEKVHSGTTMVAAAVKGNELFWASIGDSRIYILENGKIRQITRDHSYELKLKELLAQGKITQEEMDAEPRKDALISFIGIGGSELIDVNNEPLKLSGGSVVMLCSDGVTKILTDYDIEMLLKENGDLSAEELAQEICRITTSRRLRGQDNTSAIVIKIGAGRGETEMKEKAREKSVLKNSIMAAVSFFSAGLIMISVLLNIIGIFPMVERVTEPEENKLEEEQQIVISSVMEEKVTGYPYGVIVYGEDGNVYFSIEEDENSITAEEWRGRDIRDVEEELSEYGITVNVEEVYSPDLMPGMIIAQSVEKGSKIEENGTLDLIVITENSTKIDLRAEVESFMESIKQYAPEETDVFTGKNALGCIYVAYSKNSGLSDEEKVFPYIESCEYGEEEGTVLYDEHIGNTVALVVSKGYEEEEFVMPDITGCTKEEAEEILAEEGILNKVIYAVEDSEGSGVIRTKPESGKNIGKDYVIWIYFAPEDME